MNGPVHFATGYLLGRALGYREYRFETLLVACSAYSPDLDMQLQKLSPVFAHGIWTHTLVGAAAMSLALAVCAKIVVAFCRRPATVSLLRLWGLALLGAVAHLLLDAFTFYESAADATHHVYFWPFWNFPWHINTVFPGVSWIVRMVIEVAYSVTAFSFIVLYLWAVRRQNPFRMFDPRGWFRKDGDEGLS